MQGEEGGVLNILATEILLSICNSAIYSLGHHWTRNGKHKSLGVLGGGFKNRRRRNVARMWPVWVSGYIYLYEKLKAPGHAIVYATTGVPRSQGYQSLESRGIYFCLVL